MLCIILNCQPNEGSELQRVMLLFHSGSDISKLLCGKSSFAGVCVVLIHECNDASFGIQCKFLVMKEGTSGFLQCPVKLGPKPCYVNDGDKTHFLRSLNLAIDTASLRSHGASRGTFRERQHTTPSFSSTSLSPE